MKNEFFKQHVCLDGETPSFREPEIGTKASFQKGMILFMSETKAAAPIGQPQIRHFHEILQRYRTAKAAIDARCTEAERWWRLRNTGEESRQYALARDDGHHSASAWLHNVIVNKHADATDAYPIPQILPRGEEDVEQAEMLSRILPCILEQNHFERTWSELSWQKLKTGTGVCKIVWDARRAGGLGDIAIEKVDLRDIYYDSRVRDIQHSPYLFHLEWEDEETLCRRYPELAGKDLHSTLAPAESEDDRLPVIEVYYKIPAGGRETLQYCRYVGDQLLFATENDPELREKGLYDHARYPFVLDPLFPIDGSPCGYGYIDLCRGAQIEIDLLKTAFVRNALVGATPRYFSRGEGVCEEEFLDLTCPVVHVSNASEDTLRRIEHDTLAPSYIDLYDRTVKELRETSGNTETGTGNVSAGVTAASAIAALQEASGKSSRDANAASYRAFGETVELCIELIRQFYTLPRCFRITESDGGCRFARYSADSLRPIHQIGIAGEDLGWRLPLFDVKIRARRRNAYSAAAQNELTLELFRIGFFDPARRGEALSAAALLDFEGKEEILRQLEADAVGM